VKSQLRRIILITVSVAIVVAVVFFVDFGTLLSALGGLSSTSLLILFMLLAVSSLIKAVRWAFYLRAANLDISWRNGMTTYLAGMSAGALPGGSWLPVRLAQEHGNVRMRQAAASLFVAFVGDIIGISIVAWAGLLITRQPGPTFLLPAIGLAMASMLIAMGRSRQVWNSVDRLLARSRVTRRWLPQESDIQSRVNALMRPSVIARGTLFSVATTLVSAVILVVVVRGLTVSGISWRNAIYVHGFSETAAIVIPIPGGIGISDSSKAGLLNSLGIGWVRATYVVLALRSADLLFKTIVGSLLLVVFYNRLLLSALKLRSRAGVAGRHAKRVWTFGSRVTRNSAGTAWNSGGRIYQKSRRPTVAAAAIQTGPATQPAQSPSHDRAPVVQQGEQGDTPGSS
jgi:putative heme transporter